MRHYVIRGGAEGQARLDVLTRVMWPTTSRLLQQAGISQGMDCLDVGCGGGQVSLELARLVGPAGRVVGIDMDATKLELARQRAEQQGLRVEFEGANVHDLNAQGSYDLVYARFLLTHLREPADVVGRMLRALRPGGVMIVEDIEISASFAYPVSAALVRHVEWYQAAVLRRGGDPNIGPKLPSLLHATGVEEVQVTVVQPTFLQGEGKMVHQLTMENIAAVVIDEGLATPEEVERVTSELAQLADASGSLVALPRIFQVWGTRTRQILS